jgi:hypothetical protein
MMQALEGNARKSDRRGERPMQERKQAFLFDLVVPGERIVMRSIKSPFPMRVTYSFEDRDAATVARVRVEGGPEGFYRMAGGLMAPAVKRNIQSDVKRLKELMETSPR